MKITPSKKIVLLKLIRLEDLKPGTLTVVQEKQPEIGEVIAVGEGKMPIKMKKGDTVAFRRYGESKFYFGSEERVFVSFEDILGVVKK
jgi:co-chaperonin GroES (HSP10)